MKNIELKELVGGALQEQFSKAFERVVENLQNPNTPYKNSREITIKLKFTQNEMRDDVKCGISVSEKLAAQSPDGNGLCNRQGFDHRRTVCRRIRQADQGTAFHQ